MNIENLYDQLKAINTELPSMVTALMGACKQSYCDCRQNMDEDRFDKYYTQKSEEIQESLDASIKALMHNPNIRLVSQPGSYLDHDVLEKTPKLQPKRIELREVN